MPPPLSAIYSLWGVWVASWVLASAWSGQTLSRPKTGSEFAYRIFTMVGVGLLFFYSPGPHSGASWFVPDAVGWTMAALVAAGFLFSWWARLHLGRLWSGTVTRKTGHRVIDTGPYRVVRHPIYTGIIVASYATAIAKGSGPALLGASAMLLGWYAKAKLEESFLRAELGASAYDAYAARVPMLMPLL